jgi:hypothetical protein
MPPQQDYREGHPFDHPSMIDIRQEERQSNYFRTWMDHFYIYL